MDNINIEYLEKCIETLEKSYSMIKETEEGTVDYEMYRNSLVKGFEMTLEQCGKLLKKVIGPYFSSKKAADTLSFKDVFRHAFKYSLINEDETERWMKYRDNRNNTAHNYGRAFAEENLTFIEDFIRDSKNLKETIEKNGQTFY